MNDDKYKLYKHIFPNGKVYIGITKRIPECRWGYCGLGYKETNRIYDAIKKYGWDNIEHIIVFENLSKEQAEKYEVEEIKKHRSMEKEFGYNSVSGGGLGKTGYKHSEEIRQKIKDALVYTYPNRGKKASEETRRKLRESHLGQVAWNKGIKTGKANPIGVKKRMETIQARYPNFNQSKDTRIVMQISLDNKNLVKLWKNIITAQKELNIKNIHRACYNNAIAGGYKWNFLENVEI
jgi:group I intron endonuclease